MPLPRHKKPPFPHQFRSFETGEHPVKTPSSTHSAALHLLAMALFTMAPGGIRADAGRVIRVLQNFESGPKTVKTVTPSITAESSSETSFGSNCLKVTVAKDFKWRWTGWGGTQDLPLEMARLAVLSCPYLPPETDAIRLRVRLPSGRAILSIGGPVSQMGNSDVFCDPQLIEPSDEWKIIEISLNHRLVRNFRRPNFTAELPLIYYTRWAQEPVCLYLAAPPEALRTTEDTVLFMDQIELVARGEGKPFPTFEGTRIEKVETIASFEVESDMTNVFSLAHGYSTLKAFEAGYRRPSTSEGKPIPEHIRRTSPFIQEEGFLYPAPRYRRVEGSTGTHALQAEGIWTEEGQIVTLKTLGNPKANALAFTIRPEFPSALAGHFAFEHEGQPAHAVDFVVFVSPKGTDFPWHDIEATAELKEALRTSGYQGPGARYDYLVTMDRSPAINQPDIRQAGSFGFYTARRYLPAKAWSTTIIPFADFVCVYGQGACREMQSAQLPLSPTNIAAVGLLAPYGSGHGTIALDELAYAKVPGSPAELRSFWQVPDLSPVKLLPLPRYGQPRPWVLMTAEGDAPIHLK